MEAQKGGTATYLPSKLEDIGTVIEGEGALRHGANHEATINGATVKEIPLVGHVRNPK